MKEVQISKGAERHVERGHLWIFSGAVKSDVSDVKDGELVKIFSGKQFLGIGYFNSKTSIAIRVLTFKDEDVSNQAFWTTKIQQAYELRNQCIDFSKTNMFRLVNAEGDYLPGLTIDIYDKTAVIQISTFGMEQFKIFIIQALKIIIGANLILERKNSFGRSIEGLEQKEIGDKGWISPLSIKKGFKLGEEITCKENKLKFSINLVEGQKTGFFLDQRDKRNFLGKIAKGKKVLNLFAYTGGFGVYALSNGAEFVLNIDASQTALDMSQRNFKLNKLKRFENLQMDIFKEIENVDVSNFDIVVVDPPSLIKSKDSKKTGEGAYYNLNKSILKRMKVGDMLMTFSCSSHYSFNEFYETVSNAAANANRKIQIIKQFRNGVDHPMNSVMPETEYLKGLGVRILE